MKYVKLLKLYESSNYDVSVINAAIGYIEDNSDQIAKVYGNQPWKGAVSILVDLREYGDKGRDYGKVKGLEKANEIYNKALNLAKQLKDKNPKEFARLSNIGSNTYRYFRRNIKGKNYIIGKREDRRFS